MGADKIKLEGLKNELASLGEAEMTDEESLKDLDEQVEILNQKVLDLQEDFESSKSDIYDISVRCRDIDQVRGNVYSLLKRVIALEEQS